MRLNYITYRFSVVTVTVILTTFLLWVGCKEKYALPATLVDKNYLVVEGFINNGNDTTEIKLSRTVKPEDNAYILPEQNATVSVIGNNGEIYYLDERSPGTYRGGPYLLNGDVKYGIKIQTANGKEYESDFTEVKYTPPIDSINWTREETGVQIYANTHDPENNSRYYAWQLEETWEFYSYAWSSFEFNDADSTMLPRTDPGSIFHCWQSSNSSNILIASSAKLSQDIIYLAPLTFIPDDSWKISSLYSILVKQRVLSKETFEYLEKMKKNSEQLGTIFDPQPSTSSGNIRCLTDPTEIVIGQAYVSSIVEKRIFITRGEVPGWRYRFPCEQDTVLNRKDSLAIYFGSSAWEAISPITSPMGGQITHYSAANRFCMDCTLRGTSIKPDFWP